MLRIDTDELMPTFIETEPWYKFGNNKKKKKSTLLSCTTRTAHCVEIKGQLIRAQKGLNQLGLDEQSTVY